MTVSVLVSIKEIVAMGRDLPWPRPEVCPRCDGNRVWGHGSCLHFLTVLLVGFYCDVIDVRIVIVC